MTLTPARIAVCLVVSLLLAPARSASAQPPSTQRVSELTVNGLKVLVKQRPSSRTVTAGLFVRGGAQNITAANAGIEALALDLATESTARYPRERLRRELARTASVLSYGVNYDYSVLSLATTRRHFDSAWEMFVEAALRPGMAAEDFERVKQRRLSNLGDDADSPDSLLQILQAGVAYAGHPYQNDPRGTVAAVERITLEDVTRYHRQLLQTSRLLLVIVGDLDPADIERKTVAAFGSLPVGAYRPAPLPPLAFASPILAVTARDLPTNYVQGVYAAPTPTSPDIYPMRVASSILRNRIFEEVRVKRSLSYAPDAFLNEQGAGLGGIYVTAVDANQAIQVMLREIATLQTVNVGTDEITATTQSFLTTYYQDEETNAAQAGAVARAELIGGGWQTMNGLIDRLRAVTPQEVRRVASTYIRNLQFVVVGNPLKIDRQIFLKPPGR